jgi:hypothetical protein
MLAKRHAAGLGCGNLKAALAGNGNEPLLPWEKAGAELVLG